MVRGTRSQCAYIEGGEPMKIIKRNGAEVPFDITKIITAVTKASDSVGGQARLSREQITQIAAAVTDQCQQLNRAVSVEEVQDLVENQLMDIQAHDVARHYITYRYVQSLKRQTNTTDERILSLIECQNEEVKQENANKNPTVNSVQRDYMAGEISKDLTARLLLDPEIVKAHQEGLIHFHDSDYFAQHMHNCDLVNLEDMLQNGTVISGTYIEKPHSFSTACNIATQIIAQVASNQYGGQSISLTHLAPFVDVSRKKIAAEVELEMEGLDVSAERKKEIVERRLRNEINRGVQTIQYQVVTLMTTNGQAPFITVFMYLGEARNPQEKADLAIIIEKQKAELQRIEETKRHKEQQVSLAEQELKQVKAEIRTDKLKKTATNAATAIASGVGSLFGSGKLKELEHHIEQLHQEITKRDKATDELKIQIQQIQEQHSRQIRNLQRIHNQELEAKDKEISRLSTLLEKAHKWFPMFKEMLRMEKLCAVIGFTKDMIENLLTKKESIQCSGKIYSEEHRWKFDIKNDIFRVEKHPMDSGKLMLTINRQPIVQWFKEQWEKLQQNLRNSVQREQKSRGFRI